MPVKLGKKNTMGCSGGKPWPLLSTETGAKEACAGPTRADALRALQARNMAHAGIPLRKGDLVVTAEGIEVR